MHGHIIFIIVSIIIIIISLLCSILQGKWQEMNQTSKVVIELDAIKVAL